jgi:hypothetical protein
MPAKAGIHAFPNEKQALVFVNKKKQKNFINEAHTGIIAPSNQGRVGTHHPYSLQRLLLAPYATTNL